MNGNIIKLLLMPRAQRTTGDVTSIMVQTRGLKFFSDLPEPVHRACCAVMKVAFFDAGGIVFHYGDPGTSFCIVLNGAVDVLVPSLTSTTLSLATSLSIGSAFGELALLNNQPRAATIRAHTDLTLAVLQKDDYDRILKSAQDMQMREKVKFLRTFPLFRDWTQVALSKLTYFFLEMTYKRGDLVFCEGQNVADVFFLKVGEFQLSKMMTSTREVSPEKGLRPKGKRPKPRPVMVKTGRVMLGLEDALHNAPYGYTCTCISEIGVLWAVSKEECLKRCQYALTAAALKARVSLETRFLKSRIGEINRADELIRSFDKGPESSMKSDRRLSVSPVRASLAVLPRKDSNPYQNFLLAPHQAINYRLGTQPRNTSLSSPHRKTKRFESYIV